MSYLIAKRFEEQGCIAMKTKHGKELSRLMSYLQKLVGDDGIQLVTISRPSAYGEYEPYNVVEDKEQFIAQVIEMKNKAV